MSDRLQHVADDLADAADLIARRLPEARQRLRDAMRGQPGAQVLDRGPGRAGGHSDPTASAGLVADPARVDEVALLDAVHRAITHVRRAADLVERYTPRPPSSIERRVVGEANEPKCQSCARIEIRPGIPVGETPLTKKPTDVAGNLAEPAWLCRWCFDWVRATGRLPYRREIRAHVNGERVFVPVKPPTTKGAKR